MKKFTFISWMELGLGIGIETVVGSLDASFINRSIVIKTFFRIQNSYTNLALCHAHKNYIT